MNETINDPSARKRILVVDDDPKTCSYLAQILTREDWQVEAAGDGPTALALVQYQQYHAVILDYLMPVMNGAELCRRLDERRPGIPKILLTGFPTIDTIYPAVAAGVNRVLAKPFDPPELIRLLHEMLPEPFDSNPTPSGCGG
jgi:CheY-like chemotaxis protein